MHRQQETKVWDYLEGKQVSSLRDQCQGWEPNYQLPKGPQTTENDWPRGGAGAEWLTLGWSRVVTLAQSGYCILGIIGIHEYRHPCQLCATVSGV